MNSVFIFYLLNSFLIYNFVSRAYAYWWGIYEIDLCLWNIEWNEIISTVFCKFIVYLFTLNLTIERHYKLKLSEIGFNLRSNWKKPLQFSLIIFL